MNKSEKRNFVKNLCDSIKNEVVEKINHDKLPESWDKKRFAEYLAGLFKIEFEAITQ